MATTKQIKAACAHPKFRTAVETLLAESSGALASLCEMTLQEIDMRGTARGLASSEVAEELIDLGMI